MECKVDMRTKRRSHVFHFSAPRFSCRAYHPDFIDDMVLTPHPTIKTYQQMIQYAALNSITLTLNHRPKKQMQKQVQCLHFFKAVVFPIPRQLHRQKAPKTMTHTRAKDVKGPLSWKPECNVRDSFQQRAYRVYEETAEPAS